MIGFGIQSKDDFRKVTEYSDGGIIGTAFVKILLEKENWKENATNFIQSIVNLFCIFVVLKGLLVIQLISQ